MTRMSQNLMRLAQQLSEQFAISEELINEAVEHFIFQVNEGLEHETDKGLPMIPTYVTCVPKGSETGTLLSVDLGGTNFRVCSIQLNGDSTYEIIQEKERVPSWVRQSSSHVFFGYVADKIKHFLQLHHNETDKKDIFKLGFTFSFPIDQISINQGRLIRWTKGFDIKDAVGKDICQLLQAQIDKRQLPVHVTALINDTVGTLMSRAYTKPTQGQTVVGCIFGTGTNGAYSEKVRNIAKLNRTELEDKIMVINTEWGSFDNELKILPNTKYDKQLDNNSSNPRYHMFEKRVSGMFLGELLRLVLLDLYNQGMVFPDLPKDSKLYEPWSTCTSVPSRIHEDDSPVLEATQKCLYETYGANTCLQERQAIQTIVKAIGKRSAYLSAIPLAGLIIHTRALEKFKTVDVGADGSVVEFYPDFEKMVREALRKTRLGCEGESRISFGIAKDGSGIGAALCALLN